METLNIERRSTIKIGPDTKLSDCTLGDVVNYLRENGYGAFVTNSEKENAESKEGCLNIDGKVYYKGIRGICHIFNVGRSKAIEYSKSEWLKEAIVRQGSLIYVCKETALALFTEHFNAARI